jgi:hypothetical protein
MSYRKVLNHHVILSQRPLMVLYAETAENKHYLGVKTLRPFLLNPSVPTT